MKSIEIKTTQNVTLEYELADLRDRIVAYLIDLLAIGIGISTLSFIGFAGLGLNGPAATVYAYFLFSVFLFYSLAMEILNKGQSLGKMAMKIQVIKTVGGRGLEGEGARGRCDRAVQSARETARHHRHALKGPAPARGPRRCARA